MDGRFQVFCALQVTARVGQPERTAVTVGVGDVMDARNRSRGQPPGSVRGQAHRELRAAAVAVAQREDVLALGMKLSEKNGSLVGLGAAVGKKRLLQFSRRHGGELFCEADVRFGGVERGNVLEPSGLLLDRAGDFVVAVPDADSDDAAEEIEILLAVKIVNVTAFRVVDDQRLVIVVGDAGKKVLPVLIKNFLFFHRGLCQL